MNEDLERKLDLVVNAYGEEMAARMLREVLADLTPTERKTLHRKIVQTLVKNIETDTWKKVSSAMWEKFHNETGTKTLIEAEFAKQKDALGAKVAVYVPAAIEQELPGIIARIVPDALASLVRTYVKGLTQR